jgi:hypothetical protein
LTIEELVGVLNREEAVHQMLKLIHVGVEDDGLVRRGEGFEAALEHAEDGGAATSQLSARLSPLLAYGDSFLKTSVCVAHDHLS